MELTVLAVPDCPNVMLLEQRLTQVMEGRRDVTVNRRALDRMGNDRESGHLSRPLAGMALSPCGQAVAAAVSSSRFRARR